MKEQDMAAYCSQMVNGSYNAEKFCKAMGREHKSLQQAFTSLMFQWIKYVASDEYDYDGRNELAHKQAKAIKDTMGEEIFSRLPLI